MQVEEQHPGKWPTGSAGQQAECYCYAVMVMKANHILSCLSESGDYSPQFITFETISGIMYPVFVTSV